MAATVLLPSGSNVSVKVHPVVLFSICDAYTRRKENQDRVIGTLLGVVADNVIEVKNCYVVPHNESSEQVMVDVVHHKTMFELHQKVAPHESIVGWFATGSDLYNSDALIQEFYSKESTHPVHMVVDTTLKDEKFSVQAYTSRVLALGDKVLATEFIEIPCDTIVGDIERVGAELMLTGFNDPSPDGRQKETANKSFSDETETLAASMARLADLVAKASDYVDGVMSGKVVGDPAVGRYLADTVALVPHLARPDFERIFNESVQDSMVVTYLSDLLRAHVGLAERLGTAALPIM
ncbi:eukaryotic translation initiation factor 3f [Volvox carteri f. nagariensis]|uniref:Eukaryotic translation initiation factor 3 subunit F n=1 Tax=Volvox carteri f. nagariensis TaxID=3068 RepID=D8TWC8_VOLCA|nr:eukaryotic translation initiation factor 3f [Volvox carteri f. nagariensis]EFJ48132.1 eukaryotic translation initiation factor 3f [Volvox carteri f. nagariensis]|eukprot:XP_002950817.1 eukaryotic translation initiation factor 3f [Volvox carteri f. nagariensis]